MGNLLIFFMPDSTLKKPVVIDKWLGMYSSLPSHLIPDFYVANSRNISFSSIGYINPFPFYSLFLTHTSAGHFVNDGLLKKSDGQEIPLLLFDNDSTATLMWYNSVGNKLEILLASLTTGKRMAFSGTGFDTTNVTGLTIQHDGIFFCNGVMNYSFWNGAIGTVASNTATTITLNAVTGFTTAASLGFTSTGTVIVGGVEYAYGGLTGWQLTGLTAVPTLTVNDGVAQAVDDSTYSAVTKFDLLSVQDGRVWGALTTAQVVKYSKVGDGTSWTAGDTPADGGYFDVLEGTGPITNIATFKDFMCIFKQDLVKYYQILYPTATTKARNTNIIRQGDDVGCAGPDASLSLEDRVYYVSPKGGVRWIGQSDTSDGFTFEDLTNTIRPTLKDGVFTSSKLVFYEKERVMLATYKNDSDSTFNDRQITIEFVEDDALAKVRPVNINDWPIEDFFKYGGNLYAVSGLEEKIYKLFDGYTKDGAPATSLVTLKRYSFGNRFVRKRGEWLAVRGRIADGQLLHFILSYDRQGSLTTLEGTLEADESKFITTGEVHVIGEDEIGTNPIGGNLDEVDELSSFLVFFDLPTSHFFSDLELTIYSEGINSDGVTVGTRFTIEDVAFMVSEEQLSKDSYKSKPFNILNINDI